MSKFHLNLLQDLPSLNAILELVKSWSREIFYATVFGSCECSSLFISAKYLYFSAFQPNWSPWSHLFGEIMTQNFLNNVLQKCRANLSYQVYLHVKKLVFVSAFPNICKCNSALNSRDIKRAEICRDITIQREYLYCCPLSGNLFSFSSLQFRIFADCKMLSASV